MNEQYRIIDISEYEPNIYEQMGTKSKFWFVHNDKRNLLFKSNNCLNKAGLEIERPGEDWAEKVSCEIAKIIGLPHASYELATYHGQPGVITENFVQPHDSMVLGNVLLSKLSHLSGLNTGEKGTQNRLHRVIVILEAIVKSKPKNWNSLPKIKTALDVFCGYLMLDALISNQDRHEENWGIIISSDGKIHLAPTFDHAASLGRNESDESRASRLSSNDTGQAVATYVQRAKSQGGRKN